MGSGRGICMAAARFLLLPCLLQQNNGKAARPVGGHCHYFLKLEWLAPVSPVEVPPVDVSPARSVLSLV